MRALSLAVVMILSLLVGGAIAKHPQMLQVGAASSEFTTETTKEIVAQNVLPTAQPAAVPAKAEAAGPVAPTAEKIDVLTLGSANTLTLRGEVTGESMAQLQTDLTTKSAALPNDATIYLVLDTPGGEIDAGNQFIDTAKAVPQKVKTVTVFAASMGFHIAQNLGDRIITPSGVLMSHRARAGGMTGQVDGELETRVNFLKRMIDSMDLTAATRMGLSLPAYKAKIVNEYWVRGADSVADKAADKVMLARCGKDMMGTYDMEFNVLIFTATVTFSKCPLISAPLAVQIKGAANADPAKMKEARDYLNEMFYQKEDFVHDYVIPGKSKITVK